MIFKSAAGFIVSLLISSLCSTMGLANVSEGTASEIPVALVCENTGCWENIIPGITTASDAISLLKARYGDENVEVGWRTITWQVQQRLRGELTINQEGVVVAIRVNFAEYEFAVADLVEIVGQPATVYISIWNCAGILIAYPEIGLVVELYPENMVSGISPTQSIQGLDLFPVSSENESSTLQIIDMELVEWQGYKNYCE